MPQSTGTDPCRPSVAHPVKPCLDSLTLRMATRCGVRVRGPGLSDQISGTDPLKDKYGLQFERELLVTIASC